MPARDLVHAWVALLALSVATVLLSSADLWERGGALVAAGVLGLAGLKAYVILTRYLELAGSRFWTGVFGGVIGAFLVLSLALYTFGSVR